MVLEEFARRSHHTYSRREELPVALSLFPSGSPSSSTNRPEVTEMSADAPPAPGGIDLGQIHVHDPSPPPSSLRLKKALNSCSESFETGDFGKSDTAVAAVVGLLNSIIEPPPSDSENAAPRERASEEALVEIQSYISSPSSNQMAVDALSLELPKVVAKFAALSDRGREIAGSIIDFLVSSCSPRDMHSILCEVGTLK